MNGERTNDRDGELSDELFFAAVRYALDELSPRARDAFEQRLLVDQQARECLAGAVAVCQRAYDGIQAGMEPVTIQAVPVGYPMTGPEMADPWPSRAGGRRTIVWTCLALAAGVLLAVGISMFSQGDKVPIADTKPDDAGRQLAVAWVTSGEWVDADGGRRGVAGHQRRVPPDDQQPDDQNFDPLADGRVTGEADEDFVWLENGGEPSSADSANDWLFEAVTMPESPAASHREG